jgi:hypothetical protein
METANRLRDVTSALFNAFLIFWVLAIGPLCWILRDGLGPNAVDSHGLNATARFLMTFSWGPVLLLLVILRLVVGHFLARCTADAAESESLA